MKKYFFLVLIFLSALSYGQIQVTREGSPKFPKKETATVVAATDTLLISKVDGIQMGIAFSDFISGISAGGTSTGTTYTFNSPLTESSGAVGLDMSAFDWTQILTQYPNLDIDGTAGSGTGSSTTTTDALPLTGGTMSGDINMASFAITSGNINAIQLTVQNAGTQYSGSVFSWGGSNYYTTTSANGFRWIPTDTESIPAEGMVYADDSDNRPKYYDGTSYKSFLLEGDITSTGTSTADGSETIVQGDGVTGTGTTADPYIVTSESANVSGLVSFSNLQAALLSTPEDGDTIFAEGYMTANDGGGGFFKYSSTQSWQSEDGGVVIGTNTDLSTQVLNYASGTAPVAGQGAWIRQNIKDTYPINPKWWGVTYGGVGVDEWAQIQAAVNYSAYLDNLKGGITGGSVLVDGYIRFSNTITNAAKVKFVGTSQAKDRLVYIGGNTIDSGNEWAIDLGVTTWGGFENVRIQGWDQHDPNSDYEDSPDYLLRYSFVDIHTAHNACYYSGAKKALILVENELTNIVFNQPFFSQREGYVLEVTATSGNERLVTFNDFTAATTTDIGYDLKGFVKTSTPINMSMNGGRIEYNYDSLAEDFAILYYDREDTGSRTSFVATGVSAFVSGLDYAYPVINAHTDDQVAYSGFGNFWGTSKLIHYRNGTVSANTTQEGSLEVAQGFSTGKFNLANQGFLDFSKADRFGNIHDERVKNKDIAFTTGDESTLAIYNMEDGEIGTPAADNWHNVTKVTDANVGDFVINLDPSGYWIDLQENLLIKIQDAGTAGADLFTKILSVSNTDGTITIENAIETAYTGTKTVYVQAVNADYVFLGSRETTPTMNLGTNTGAYVFVKDINSFVSWRNSKWTIGLPVFSGTTSERPTNYDTNAFYVGRTMYDTTIQDLIVWDGNSWEELGGGGGASTADGSETKIQSGIGATVTGTGTSTDPYIVNSTSSEGTTTESGFSENLIINGAYDTDSDWNGTGEEITGGEGTITVIGGANALIYQLFTFEEGEEYEISFDHRLIGGSGAEIRTYDTGNGTGALSANATATTVTTATQTTSFLFTAVAGSNRIQFNRGGSGSDFVIGVDNVVLRKVIEVVTGETSSSSIADSDQDISDTVRDINLGGSTVFSFKDSNGDAMMRLYGNGSTPHFSNGLRVEGDPVYDNDAANKGYVDSVVSDSDELGLFMTNSVLSKLVYATSNTAYTVDDARVKSGVEKYMQTIIVLESSSTIEKSLLDATFSFGETIIKHNHGTGGLISYFADGESDLFIGIDGTIGNQWTVPANTIGVATEDQNGNMLVTAGTVSTKTF